jgi:hypothetical protein
MKIEVATKGGIQQVDAKQIGFSVVSENWNEYQLEDGSTIRVKTVLTRVVTPIDSSVLAPDGSKLVSIQSQTLVIRDEAANAG